MSHLLYPSPFHPCPPAARRRTRHRAAIALLLPTLLLAAASASAAESADALACGWLPNCVSSLANDPPPLRFSGTAADAQARLNATLAAFPEARVTVTDEAGTEVVFTTAAGFRDLVRFRIDAARGQVDFSSRSQLGLWDLGKNRSRMTAFAEAWARTEPK